MNEDLILDEQLQDQLESDQQDDIIISDPLLESEVDPASAVYSVDYIKNGLCARDTETMTVLEFGTCVNYESYEVGVSYLSLFFGLVLGFIISKAVSDGWT